MSFGSPNETYYLNPIRYHNIEYMLPPTSINSNPIRKNI